MAEPVLAVDLGTARTAVALVAGGRATVLREPGGGGFTRSAAVCLTPVGLVSGAEAERQRRGQPGGYAANPRRALDTGAPLRLTAARGEAAVSGVAALAAALEPLRAEAEQAAGEPVHRLTLTVPATYEPGDPRREALVAAGEAAGLPDVELIDSSFAAALDTDLVDPGRDALVLVCDLGVTWSTTLLGLAGGGARILGRRSSPDGRDLAEVLLDRLHTHARSWLEPQVAAGGEDARRAQQDARAVVDTLIAAVADEPAAEGSPSPAVPPYRLTREDFDAVIEPALRGLLEDCRSVVAGAGAILGDVTALVLAGGWSRAPLVEPMLANGLGRPMRRANPVRGAARWALDQPARRVAAEQPGWRVAPLTWSIPGGGGRLLRWLVEENHPHEAGTPLALVRTGDDRVVEVTAAEPGRVLAHRIPAGGLVGPTLAVAAARDPAALLADPPPQVSEVGTDGEWLLTPQRRVLLECVDGGRVVTARAVPDGAPLGEVRPALVGPPLGGRLFVDPEGRPALLAWEPTGALHLYDLGSARLTNTFGEPEPPGTVLVNEQLWRVAVASVGRGVGRYRRGTVTIWDLASGAPVDRLSDESWMHRHPGYAQRSTRDAFTATAVAPDGLRATTRPAAGGVAVTLTERDTEVFRTEQADATGASVAFTEDGRHLLARWTAPGHSRVTVWVV
ncbi:Hsp70 family protein [Rhizomonospora bruguierae]|uniref:Hsp70 family protein n=1 Tax=Rhizomonospora bruguierae TaxID=1581705 RepID=UPI001BCFA66E|nr:Hsp70 family protein [Micromonospora sp. NBRC 107566]